MSVSVASHGKQANLALAAALLSMRARAAVVARGAVRRAAELVKHVFGGKEEETASIKDVDATIDDIAGSFDEAERLPSS